MIKPATKMMSYQKSDDEETAVLLVPTILPTATTTTTTTTTMDRRSLKWIGRVASVAGMLLLLLVVAGGGGTVGLQREEETTAAEGLVVAFGPAWDEFCEPALGTFGGYSMNHQTPDALRSGEDKPFQTCYSLVGGNKNCWSNSYWVATELCLPINKPYCRFEKVKKYYECIPVGEASSFPGGYALSFPISGKRPSYEGSCGKPCQNMEHMPGCANSGDDVYDPTKFSKVPAICCKGNAVLRDGKYLC